MRIVIVGAGAVGVQIASELVSENKDVVIIEKDPDRAKQAAARLDCLVINEEGNDIDTLKRAGIDRADFFLSVTTSDEVNMICCAIVSSEFRVPNKVARVRNLDYAKGGFLERSFLGIDYIVNPEVEAANVIANTVEHGATSDVMMFRKASVTMRNTVVDSKSVFRDRTLIGVREKLKGDYLIAGIMRGDDFIVPSGHTLIREGDNVYLVASTENFEKIFSNTGFAKAELKDVVIVGGGKIGTYVTERLIRRRRIKIIERDYERCKAVAEEFPDAIVINADISDEEIFDEERIQDSDLIITTTDNQELNILAAAYAKAKGVRRAIALVNQHSYLNIATRLGIDSTVSPRFSTADTILKYIRGKNIESVHSIFYGKAEVIEMTVQPGSPVCDKALKDISLPGNSLILTVTRHPDLFIPDGSVDQKVFIPGGNFVIRDGDDILIITGKESVSGIEKLFYRSS